MQAMKCFRCGKAAMTDTRGGSVEYILVCGCDQTWTWVDEGSRSGYYSNDVKIIPAGDGGIVSDPSWHGYDNR